MANFSWTFDDSRYELVKRPLNFLSAITAAREAGGFLAEINSLEENSNVFSNVFSNVNISEYGQTNASDGGGSAYVWLGGSDSNAEGVWKWMTSGDDILLSRPEWGSGQLGHEPDNFNEQDALALGLENWPSGSSDDQGFDC